MSKILSVLLAVLLLPFQIIFILLLSVSWFIMWIVGLPIEVKRGGRRLGYIRWFKFIKT